jgi:uncharacterized membrane protein YcaP (DUF421 family)
MDLVLRATVVFFLILLVVIGDLVQQGVMQADNSVTGVTTVIATLAVLTVGTAHVSYRVRAARPLLEGSPVVLMSDGRILDRTCAASASRSTSCARRRASRRSARSTTSATRSSRRTGGSAF